MLTPLPPACIYCSLAAHRTAAARACRASNPPVPTLQRALLPALCKRTAEVAALERSQASSRHALEAAVCATKAQREAQGVGDSMQEPQLTVSAPRVDEATVGSCLEVLCAYDLPDGARKLL
eukprot:6192002-Pleurochrysis_carterae.AAC.1